MLSRKENTAVLVEYFITKEETFIFVVLQHQLHVVTLNWEVGTKE
jgi:hypothetical protein